MLRQDLERYLAGLPVLAHRGSRRYRLGKFLRRHRVEAAAAAMVLAALLTGLSIAVCRVGARAASGIGRSRRWPNRAGVTRLPARAVPDRRSAMRRHRHNCLPWTCCNAGHGASQRVCRTSRRPGAAARCRRPDVASPRPIGRGAATARTGDRHSARDLATRPRSGEQPDSPLLGASHAAATSTRRANW